MKRCSPGDRSALYSTEACLVRAHCLMSVAINLLMDSRKELREYEALHVLGRESYRVAKEIEWLCDEIERTRRSLETKPCPTT